MGVENRLMIYQNPNPSKNVCGDCVVRALSLALNEEWSVIYADLCELGGHIYRMPNDKDCFKTYLTRRGFQRTPISNKKGSKRPTVRSFAEEHKTGTYVLEVAHHLVTVKDGHYYDIWDCGNKSLYGFWNRPDPRAT